MPPKMSHHVSPRSSSSGINKLGARSTISRGTYAPKNECGSSMKNLLYAPAQNENPMRPCSWGDGGDSASQGKVYRQGESVNSTGSVVGIENLGWNMKRRVEFAPVGVLREGVQVNEDASEPEYPFPGCRATCDGCGDIVTRFYHCQVCDDPTLFDLCTHCCTALYLPASKRPASMRVPHIEHPTHVIDTHAMELVTME